MAASSMQQQCVTQYNKARGGSTLLMNQYNLVKVSEQDFNEVLEFIFYSYFLIISNDTFHKVSVLQEYFFMNVFKHSMFSFWKYKNQRP